MEVCFLDVAQGTSQVILLGEQRAIVIDSGPSTGSAILAALDLYRIEFVEHFIVSHNHDDHVGGAIDLLTQFRGRIGTIWFVQDTHFFATAFWDRICEQLNSQELSPSQVRRVERENVPREIFADVDKSQSLTICSPWASQNLQAQASGNANATSAILVLEYGTSRIVFAGDSEISQWEQIASELGKPLECDLMAVPHHGGLMAPSKGQAPDWLYTDAVRPRMAVISVGTSNQHKHPRAEVIGALRSAGASVMCTQITKRCCNDLEALRPAVLQPLPPIGRSLPTADRTQSGNSRNVACAGTILVEVQKDLVRIQRSQEHAIAVARLQSLEIGTPMCVAG